VLKKRSQAYSDLLLPFLRMQELILREGSLRRPFEILLVEDSPTDVLLATEALNDANVENHLHVVTDGVEAKAYLNREHPYTEALRPDLIFLDLNLPRKDGREVLAEIKENPELKDIPVIVLTTSNAEEDIRKSYANHANCYITKPLDFERFARIVREVVSFWFTVVTLPPSSRP
jgi:two-component system, chemotaxis family, response regulator Rcp1